MHDRGKSDGRVVPEKPPNKPGQPGAEVVEERRPAKGNVGSETRPGHRAGLSVSSELDRVRQVARRDKDVRFTALLHHVTVERLEVAYRAIRPGAAPGVDGVTWRGYGQDLEENLRDLHARVHGGAYRARPSRRAYIPKPDGRPRPLGVAALEDKILQRAVAEVLNAIYEVDFLGFSYGFRPGRSPHDALDALAVGITSKKVNWLLDADIRDYFSSLDHSWLERFLKQRIADKRVLRLIQKWLKAGVIEDGVWSETMVGTPQGASASTLLANVYLHVCPQGKRGDVEGRFVIRAVPVMEVGPPGSPCRRGAQTAVMSCRSKAGVGSDYGKGPLTAGQVCDEKTNVVEPLLTHRKTMTTSQPGSVHISGRASRHWRGVVRGRPACRFGGVRC